MGFVSHLELAVTLPKTTVAQNRGISLQRQGGEKEVNEEEVEEERIK